MLFVESFPIPIQDLVENFTDKDFVRFCAENSDLRIERDKDRNILVAPPFYSETGRLNVKILGALYNWNEQLGLGLAFGAATGFTLPNGAICSPDVSWISMPRWDALSKKNKSEFANICPDFVFKWHSKNSQFIKVQEYIENGCRLGWLIDPIEKQTHIYRQNGSIEIINGFANKLSGEDVLPGFEFDLKILEK